MFGVEALHAAPDPPLAVMQHSGCVTDALAIQRRRAVGLALAARSAIKAKPRDTKDHAKRV